METVDGPESQDVEPRKNIPVICNSGDRREEGSKKPHGIHLNPRFFPNLNQHMRPIRHEPGPPIFHPPRFSEFRPPYHFDAISQRCPQPYQYNNSPGPGPVFPAPPHWSHRQHFPPPNRFKWPRGPRHENFFNNNFQPIVPGPFQPPLHNQCFFPSNNTDNNFGRGPPVPNSELQHGFQQMAPVGEWETGANAGPSHYEAFNLNPEQRDVRESHSMDRKRPRETRSRSRSQSSGSWRSRSLSASSSGLESHYSRRRSRSLSAESRRSTRSRSRSRSHSSESIYDEDSIWDSANEPNSDSDLDLSKPLDSLTSHVAESKSLLRNALKCLGSAKVQTMIPLEFAQMERKELFGMCKDLLDETEDDKLIKVMEGSWTIKDDVDEKPVTQKNDSQSDTNQDENIVKQKLDKRKKTKKKRKKKKKKKHETESDEDEESESEGMIESLLADDNKSGSESNEQETFAVATSVPKADTSRATTQQSLLELIQIEYKTKAINVMLKNLGVANEISSLVSTALQTNGIAAIHGLTAGQEMLLRTEINTSRDATNESKDASLMTESALESNYLVEEDNEAILEADGANQSGNDENLASAAFKVKTSEDNHIETEQFESVNSISKNDSADEIINDPIISDASDMCLQVTDFIKDVDQDVLDLGVGANEKIEFPDI